MSEGEGSRYFEVDHNRVAGDCGGGKQAPLVGLRWSAYKVACSLVFANIAMIQNLNTLTLQHILSLVDYAIRYKKGWST